MDLPVDINALNYTFVAVYMVSVTLKTSHGEIVTALRNLRRMGRALLANFVLVSTVGFILVRALHLLP